MWHIYHDIEIPRPKSHDIEIPRPKNRDIEKQRQLTHDIVIPRHFFKDKKPRHRKKPRHLAKNFLFLHHRFLIKNLLARVKEAETRTPRLLITNTGHSNSAMFFDDISTDQFLFFFTCHYSYFI